MTTTQKYSRADAIRTVTGREIQVAMRSKGLIITAAIVLVVVVGGVFLISWLNSRVEDNPSLAVAGVDETAVTAVVGEGIDVTSVDSRDAAVDAIKDDGKDAALVRDNDVFTLIADGTPDDALVAASQVAASAIAQNDALDAVGVDPGEFAAALPDATVETVDVSDEATDDTQPAVVTTMLGTMVILTFIMTFAANVGGRVTEEKSSRVVEIILATIRPLDLLIGKVVAMLIVGFVGTAVILGAALASMAATGMLADVDLDPATLGILMVSYILGMLFFSALYAAAGSLVSRAEELGSTQMPVMLLFFAVMYPPIFGWSAMDSTVMEVLAWVPPMSMGVAPMQYAAGNLSLLGLAASFLLLAVATLLVLMVVARIYRGSILNNGRRLTWMRALQQA
ncbi:ABC transporter permease [Corynebacterium variabile]|uniref:ABC transporter permease n=1 Tax=Corynebacterium variabile TaxID=1727 RepID=A0A0X2NNI1_9CORY|nr:ABC transporter permease [Corynebacterium variabile]MDN6677800.1 ABC transporter permease [Corynebacterium variabile]GEC87490.1 ABC transporter permease [Corynebacterium variabile]CUU66271.1 ABC-type Na+ efflux pump, permease component [Corynebacterium variabile]